MTETTAKPDRRVERSRQAILAATLQLLAPDGDVGSLTVEAVAARSGVAKTTIYRRWRDKWELALDAVMIDMLPRFDEPVDVGDTRTELLTFVNSVVTMLAATPSGPAMQGLVSQIATDPELARIYRERVVQPRHAQLAPVINAASPAATCAPIPTSACSTNSCSGRSSTACCSAAPRSPATSAPASSTPSSPGSHHAPTTPASPDQPHAATPGVEDHDQPRPPCPPPASLPLPNRKITISGWSTSAPQVRG